MDQQFAEVRAYQRMGTQSANGRKMRNNVSTNPATIIYLPKKYDEIFNNSVVVIFSKKSIMVKNSNLNSKNIVKYDRKRHSVPIPYREDFIGKYEIEEIDNGLELFKI